MSIAPAPAKSPARNASRGGRNQNSKDANDLLDSMEADAPPPLKDYDELVQSITVKQGCLVQPICTITMYIPAASVGAVIGRRGQTIATIQKVASAAASTTQPVRVSVMTDLSYTYSDLDFSDDAWTPVVIRADPRAAFTAAQKIEETVTGGVDQVVLDLPLSRMKHAAIVGKRGCVLQNISADTNVRIMVPKRDLHHDIVQLEGDLHNVKQCLDRLLQVASKGKKTDDSPSASITVTQLPSQTKMRGVSRKTDTSIKKKKVQDEWQLIVTGSSQENVQAAIAIIQMWKDAQAAGNQETPSPPQVKRPGGRGRWGKKATSEARKNKQSQQSQVPNSASPA